jgi:tagatose 1,6-diphosphate aldolase
MLTTTPGFFSLVEDGFVTILAADHRTSLARMLNPQNPRIVPSAKLLDVKRDITKSLSPFASATLLDFEAAKSCQRAKVLAKSSSLIISLEKGGYAEVGGERITQLDSSISPLNARKSGAAGVKLKLYYNSRYPNSAAKQLELLKRVHKQCAAASMPLLLEVLLYEVSLNFWEGAVLDAARSLSPYCDLLGLQFPTFSIDESVALHACKRITKAISIPWILLSDQADFLQFKSQLELACRGGASGFAAGRTVWREAVRMPPSERSEFLNVVSSGRLIRLRNIVRRTGRRVDEVHRK